MAITEHDLGPVRGDINDSVATFTAASTRANIASGDTGKTIFGKISKWFADLKTAAFCTVVNNFTTTTANTVADGRALKTLKDQYDELNRNILFDVSHASQNPQLSAAVNVDLDNSLGDWNKPCIVLSSTANVPDNMAWGVKEVLYIDPNAVIIRITGCKSDGVNTAVWTGVYNHGSWSGWSEH